LGYTCTIVCAPTATECSCSDGVGACEITTEQNVAAGAVIDCEGRDVELEGGNGFIRVTDGIVALHARNLTINGQRGITASSTSDDAFGIDIELTGNLDMPGFLRANGDSGGGVVSVEAEGDILITQGEAGGLGITANGTAPSAEGGEINLKSDGRIEVSDPILADAADNGVAEGGSITLTAVGDVSIGARLNALGRQSSGGRILVSSQGHVDVQDTIKAEGMGVDGDGGDVSFAAERLTVGALVSVQSGVGASGGAAEGGAVAMEVGSGGIAINANINATGGEAGSGLSGGAITAECEGNVTVANGVQFLTKSDGNGGDGGDVSVTSSGTLTIGDVTIDARGHTVGGNQGGGAIVRLEACALAIGAGAEVDASGHDGGAIVLTGRKTTSISASSGFTAAGSGGGEVGEILLSYRSAGHCALDPSVDCDPGHCPAFTGTCSNNPAIQCTTNANCTSGCSTGECIPNPRFCSNHPNRPCTADGDCTGCASGACTANPDTGGTTAQFNPSPVLQRDRQLEACP
jgi:hypothetical protein